MSNDVRERAGAENRPLERRPGRGEWWLLDRLALLISALSGLAIFALIGPGSWYIDDFLNLSIAQESRLDLAYLNRPIFGHLQQGSRFVNWVLYRVAPMNYAVAAGLVCLGIAFMSWMVYRIMRLCFRPSPWMLMLTAMAGLTGLWVPVGEWWAGGSEITGCIVANVLMIHAVLRAYLGPKRLVWAALAGVWLLIGLSFYERALLGGMFAACFLLAVAARRLGFREVYRVVRQALPAYLVLLVVAVAYLLYYTSHKFVRTLPGYTHRELLHFFWTSWSSSMIPGMFGGSIQTGRNLNESFARPPVFSIATCQLVLLGIVAYGVRKLGPRALVGWLFFIPIFVTGCWAIATARLTVHGPTVGREFRYVGDLVPLGILTLGLTVLVPRIDRAALAAPEQVPSRRAAFRPRHALAAGVAVIALLTVFVASSVPPARVWRRARGVEYARNMENDIRALDAQGPYSVYTTYAPGDVTTPMYGRYSQTPRIAELLSGHPISADDLSKPMYVANASGHLIPAKLQTLATVPDICATGDQQRILKNLSQPRGRYTWTVQLTYKVPARSTLKFALNTGTQVMEATGTDRGFAVSGTGRLTFQMRLLKTLTAFGLESAQPGDCISDIKIGLPISAR
ncbi:MAG TPA: hypothetical protein VHO01_11005 [Jatrophihabitans sp.]|nr:hypothetical protein [Jatrophihabitans sp.]